MWQGYIRDKWNQPVFGTNIEPVGFPVIETAPAGGCDIYRREPVSIGELFYRIIPDIKSRNAIIGSHPDIVIYDGWTGDCIPIQDIILMLTQVHGIVKTVVLNDFIIKGWEP